MTSSRDNPEPLHHPELSEDFQILRELGRSDVAVVYVALERALEREVTLKMLLPEAAADADAAAALIREARILGRLQHPDILGLYGTRRLASGALVIVGQYVEGRTLREELNWTGPLPLPRAQKILREVGSALAHVHQQGLVHRDVRPENVHLEEGSFTARLTGFATAHPLGEGDPPPLSAEALARPAYISPEELEGDRLDPRSDVYSLGVLGYEMLTGEAPWAGESLFTLAERRRAGAPPPLEGLRPGIPDGLRSAVEGALTANAADRWATAAAFVAAVGMAPVKEAGAEDAPEPEAVGKWQDTLARRLAERRAEAERAAAERKRRRTRLLAWGGGGLLVALLALLIGQLTGGRGADELVDATGQAALPAPAAADTTPPEEAGPPSLAYAVSGDAQEGPVGDTLPRWLVVRVEDDQARPVPDVPVTFRVAAGEGTVVPDTVTTDEFGVAGTRWLPLSIGEHRVEALVADLAGVPTSFTAVAHPRGAGGLRALSPAEVSGTAGTRTPLELRVLDDRGAPLEGAEVRFTVRGGGGQVVPATAVSGADGRVRAEWVLGEAERQEVAATLAAGGSPPVVFRGQSGPRPLPVRATIAAGGTHTCSLDADGAAFCWGGNDSGQLGDGSGARSPAPARVAAPEALATLAAGVSHTCAVGVSGTVFCWGANSGGQLGDGSRTARREPVAVATDTRMTSVVTGGAHSCALDTAGRAHCWGQNDRGQLGDGSRSSRPRPVAVAGGRAFRMLTAGWDHTCGLTAAGAAYCWGRNDAGQLGDGGAIDRAEPVAVAGDRSFSAVAGGSAHTCGLTTGGDVLCWGQNSYGQLGTGSRQTSTTPAAVAAEGPFTGITAGGVHTCALTAAGAARCWGRNTYGQLGDGSAEDRASPVAVEGGLRFTALRASGAHTCGIAAGGVEYCWGFNLEGQLGDGSRSNRARPVPVARQR